MGRDASNRAAAKDGNTELFGFSVLRNIWCSFFRRSLKIAGSIHNSRVLAISVPRRAYLFIGRFWAPAQFKKAVCVGSGVRSARLYSTWIPASGAHPLSSARVAARAMRLAGPRSTRIRRAIAVSPGSFDRRSCGWSRLMYPLRATSNECPRGQCNRRSSRTSSMWQLRTVQRSMRRV